MKIWPAGWSFFGAALLLMMCAPSVRAESRTPVPFVDAGQHGYVLMLWKDPTPQELDTVLDRIEQSGSKHLTVPYFGCQSTIHSSDVGACELKNRMNASLIARQAVVRGFNVSFLPIVATPKWDWRGFFEPTDVEAWFRSYTQWVKKLAREARELGMKELVVSTEFSKLYRHENQWRRLLEEVRAEFGGPLVITTNWDDLKHHFWDAADAIGMSGYFPLSESEQPSQAELDAAWRLRRVELSALAKKWNRPLHLTEVGYPSVPTAAKTPWAYDGRTSDFAVQARCFEAFRKAWSGDPALARVNIWATEGGNAALPSFSYGFEPLGKPAEDILRRFFEFLP